MENKFGQLPKNIVDGLLELAQVLNRHQVAYALIGGLAAAYRSQPRYTEDIDFVIHVNQVALPGVLDELISKGFDLDQATAIRQWLQDHTAVLKFKGVRVDWLKPVLPCYQHIIDRATTEELLGVPVRIAAPEGLILAKLLPSRLQDLVDIERLLAANQGQLDLDYIRSEWQTVADLGDRRWREFEQMVREFYEPGRD